METGAIFDTQAECLDRRDDVLKNYSRTLGDVVSNCVPVRNVGQNKKDLLLYKADRSQAENQN